MIEGLESVLFSLRMLFGQINVAMLLLPLSIGFNRWRCWRQQRRVWLMLMLIIGAVFYSMALGLGYYDPYAWGYDDRLLVGCAVIAIVAAWRYPLISLWLTLAVVAHAFAWGESNNLWDYLFDPLTWLLALLWMLYELFQGDINAKWSYTK